MTLASTKAKSKYNAKAYSQITLRVKKDEKPYIEKLARKNGKTLNGFIIDAIKAYPGRAEEDNKILSVEEIKRAVISLVDRHPELGVEAVFLFGSYARGEADSGSDIDLCIMLEDGFTLKNRCLIDKEIFILTGKHVSIIDAEGTYENPFFIENLENEMVLLYEKQIPSNENLSVKQR